MGDDSVEPL